MKMGGRSGGANGGTVLRNEGIVFTPTTNKRDTSGAW